MNARVAITPEAKASLKLIRDGFSTTYDGAIIFYVELIKRVTGEDDPLIAARRLHEQFEAMGYTAPEPDDD